MKLAIIGAGSMGRWFGEFFKGDWEAIVTDIDLEKAERVASEVGLKIAESTGDAVMEADVVLIAVPVKETPGVIREVADFLPSGSLLLDVSSIKENVIEAIKELDGNFEMASLHPLFGPGAEDIKNKIVVSIPVDVGKRYRAFMDYLRSRGARIEEMEAKEHDRLMMVNQSMTHFLLLSYLSALRSTKNFERTKNLHSPISGSLFNLAKAFLNVNPELCVDIQVENKYASIARSSILEVCRSLDLALQARDVSVIEEIFNDAKELIGSDETESAYKRLYKKEEGKS